MSITLVDAKNEEVLPKLSEKSSENSYVSFLCCDADLRTKSAEYTEVAHRLRIKKSTI